MYWWADFSSGTWLLTCATLFISWFWACVLFLLHPQWSLHLPIFSFSSCARFVSSSFFFSSNWTLSSVTSADILIGQGGETGGNSCCLYTQPAVAVVDFCHQAKNVDCLLVLIYLMIQSIVSFIPLIPQIAIATEECCRMFHMGAPKLEHVTMVVDWLCTFFCGGEKTIAPLWQVIFTIKGLLLSLFSCNVESLCLSAVFIIVFKFLSMLILLALPWCRGAPGTHLLVHYQYSTHTLQWWQSFLRKNLGAWWFCASCLTKWHCHIFFV